MSKQQKLSFATAKRTASGSNVAKPQVSASTASKPVQTLAKDSNIKEIKEEDRYADIEIVDLSSSDDDEEDSRAKPEDVKAPTDVRTPVTRSAARKSASSTPSSSTKALKAKLEDAATEAKVEANTAKENEETRELNPKDTKYRKHYTEIKKKMGGMPTIHGEHQNKIHEILRVFDDSYEYGPCIGMTRLERWQRAKKLGFNPPQEVYDILTTKQGKEKPEYAECVFYGEV
ncbi:hypothetical protein NLJ89_g8875 [Agrocybe chaxingu]|uniref:DNA polymerase delta subunit 4 n=1 Tax=Agrocybe chaxingu TaxID=84603 RepID=A0A9W8MQE0_9AGAR|nr:hypothetical protein NLJ89_g8875 [Agrocybe chaxingu]